MGAPLTGASIREARIALGMSSAELSARVGVSASFLVAIEGGQRKIFQGKAYAKLLRYVLFNESIDKQNELIRAAVLGRPRKPTAD